MSLCLDVVLSADGLAFNKEFAKQFASMLEKNTSVFRENKSSR